MQDWNSRENKSFMIPRTSFVENIIKVFRCRVRCWNCTFFCMCLIKGGSIEKKLLAKKRSVSIRLKLPLLVMPYLPALSSNSLLHAVISSSSESFASSKVRNSSCRISTLERRLVISAFSWFVSVVWLDASDLYSCESFSYFFSSCAFFKKRIKMIEHYFPECFFWISVRWQLFVYSLESFYEGKTCNEIRNGNIDSGSYDPFLYSA